MASRRAWSGGSRVTIKHTSTLSCPWPGCLEMSRSGQKGPHVVLGFAIVYPVDAQWRQRSGRGGWPYTSASSDQCGGAGSSECHVRLVSSDVTVVTCRHAVQSPDNSRQPTWLIMMSGEQGAHACPWRYLEARCRSGHQEAGPGQVWSHRYGRVHLNPAVA